MVVFTRSNPSLLKQIQLVRALHPGAEDASAFQGTTHSFGILQTELPHQEFSGSTLTSTTYLRPALITICVIS